MSEVLLLMEGTDDQQGIASWCVEAGQHQIVDEAAFDAATGGEAHVNKHPGAPLLTYQPPDGAITQLPTYVAVQDTDAALTFDITLAQAPGLTKTVTFAPQDHVWTWGDGGQLTTVSPGGAYPSGDVTHTYTHRGTVTLTEQSEYSASYVIHTPEGIDLPRRGVPGTVKGDPASVTVRVREARAELIPPAG